VRVTPAQLAIAWLFAQGRDIVPIPGTRSIARLEENHASTTVALSADEVARIDAELPPEMAAGERYPAASMALVGR
jgi:aryl-alcohol dehydrogenase-like predicted oxidoreductase